MPSDLPCFADDYPDMVPRPQLWLAAFMSLIIGVSIGLLIGSFAKH